MSSSKETFIVEWKIRLPGSKTPVVFPLHLGMTAEEAINVICRHYSLKNKKLTIVLSPTATNPGKIIPDDTVLRTIEAEVGSEDILELWKSPYITKAAVIDGTSSIGPVREVVVDASRELSQMIPIFQRAFGIKEEFCLQHSPIGMGGSEDSTFKNVSMIARAKWLSISDSLLNQRIPHDSYLLVFPIYLFEKFCSVLLQKAPSTREGLLQKQSKTKNKISKTEERWFVLNEGFLFYFKKKGDATPRGVLTLEYYTMKYFKVEGDKKNRWTIQLSKVFAGQFVSKHGDFYMLYGSEQDVKDWAADITQKCYNTGTRKEFGVDLLQASQRRLATNSIPRVMQDCVEYLKQEGGNYEGLFRVPGSASLIEYYKDQYDQGEEVNLSECNDPHTVAGLLKLYVREMPEPLLTFGLYDKLLNAFDNYYESGEKTATEQISKVVADLPSINTSVLRYLCAFLFELGKNHQKTKMTVSNLATVFGPNLIRSQEEDVSILMKHAPAINNILEILINNQDKIFGTTKCQLSTTFTVSVPKLKSMTSKQTAAESRGWTLGRNRETTSRPTVINQAQFTPAIPEMPSQPPPVVGVGSAIVSTKIPRGKDRQSVADDSKEMEIVRLQKVLSEEREARTKAESALEEYKNRLRDLESKFSTILPLLKQ